MMSWGTNRNTFILSFLGKTYCGVIVSKNSVFLEDACGSPASSLQCYMVIAGDVKEPIHPLQRVENVVPGVVV